MKHADGSAEQATLDDRAGTSRRPPLAARVVTYVRRHHIGFIAIFIAVTAGATATALPTASVPVLALTGSTAPGTTGGAGSVVTTQSAKSKIIPWDKGDLESLDIDNDGMHSYTTSPDLFTINTPGIYEIYARIEWGPGNGTGERTLELRVNGNAVTRIGKAPGSTYVFELDGTYVRRLSAGDTLRVSARQTSGEPLHVLGRHISITWIGP